MIEKGLYKGVYMNIHVPRLSETVQGILFIIAGLVLFLHATNIIQLGLTGVIIISSILLMLYGFFKADFYEKLVHLFSGKKNK